MSSAARALVVSLALAVSLLGVAGGAGAGAHLAAVPAGTAHAGTLSWHDCDASYLCATLRVPISYRHPKQGSLGLAIVELQANGPARGDIVLNPGGPGVSGVAMLESLGFPAPYPWSDLLAHYNLVSFDPRGVGESDPVHCLSTSAVRDWLRLDGNPQGPVETDAVGAAGRQLVACCESRNSKLLLENLGTRDTAQDLDRLRAALGQTKLDYLGFSYGTYISEVYAERFPSRVGHFVLDGVFDPAEPFGAFALQQAVGFEDDLRAFFAWCKHDTLCHALLPRGAAEAWATLAHRLSGNGSLVADLPPGLGGTQRVDLGMALYGVLESLYSVSDWESLAEALYKAGQGDGTELADLAYGQVMSADPNGGFSNLIDANAATYCDDRPAPRQLPAFASLADRAAEVAPDFGSWLVWTEVECAYWPYVTGKVAPVRAPGTPEVLLVGATGDPATPYADAQAVEHQFPHAVLLTRRGEGHTSYFASTCVESYVNRFLESGQAPPARTVCPTTLDPSS